MCLERCGSTASEIKANLAQVQTNTTMFPLVSFEHFNLGPNSSLVVAENLTDVGPALHAMGVELWPMVSSYPYPPEFITWMRQVFADPQPFIDACIVAARRGGYSGFNIDWEPLADTVAPGDAAAYAAFLDRFADAMHSAALGVSVDFASWSPIWDWSLLSKTRVDMFELMSTYTDDDSVWYAELAKAQAAFPYGNLVVGLETLRTNGTAYPASQLARRFDALRAADLRRVGLWRSPVPVDFVDQLRTLV